MANKSWGRRMLLLGEDGQAEIAIEQAQEDRRPEYVERVDPAGVLGVNGNIGLQCRKCRGYDVSYTLHTKRGVDEGMIVDATCFKCGNCWSEER